MNRIIGEEANIRDNIADSMAKAEALDRKVKKAIKTIDSLSARVTALLEAVRALVRDAKAYAKGKR